MGVRRCVLIVLPITGGILGLIALGCFTAGLVLPNWIVLSDIPDVNQIGLTDTYYSGLWQFCATATSKVGTSSNYVTTYNCMPSEISNPTGAQTAIVANGFVGSWRTTTMYLGVLTTVVIGASLIFSLFAICCCCTRGGCAVFTGVAWLSTSILASLMGLTTVIYFIATYQSDAKNMYYIPSGAAQYERFVHISFYLACAATGMCFFGMFCAAGTVAMYMLHGKHNHVNAVVVTRQ